MQDLVMGECMLFIRAIEENVNPYHMSLFSSSNWWSQPSYMQVFLRVMRAPRSD